MINIIAQTFGFLAILSSVIIYSRKTRAKILFYKSMQDACWFTHYILISAYSAAATSILCFVRAILFYRLKEKKGDKLVLIIFLVLYALSAMLTWKNIFSIFPAVSSSISTVAFWLRKPIHTKILAILASCSTLLYNLMIAHSISVYVGASISIITSVISIIKTQLNN